MTAPLSRERRQAIADDIATGALGRNAIARKHHVAAGTVTNIARDEGLWFPDDWRTQTATDCRRADAELARLKREDALIREYINLPTTTRRRDGKETRAAKKLSYALYDLRRHHDRGRR